MTPPIQSLSLQSSRTHATYNLKLKRLTRFSQELPHHSLRLPGCQRQRVHWVRVVDVSPREQQVLAHVCPCSQLDDTTGPADPEVSQVLAAQHVGSIKVLCLGIRVLFSQRGSLVVVRANDDLVSVLVNRLGMLSEDDVEFCAGSHLELEGLAAGGNSDLFEGVDGLRVNKVVVICDGKEQWLDAELKAGILCYIFLFDNVGLCL